MWTVIIPKRSTYVTSLKSHHAPPPECEVLWSIYRTLYFCSAHVSHQQHDIKKRKIHERAARMKPKPLKCCVCGFQWRWIHLWSTTKSFERKHNTGKCLHFSLLYRFIFEYIFFRGARIRGCVNYDFARNSILKPLFTSSHV